MITYYSLGADRQLNEIVFAGSHDAGITQGGGNAKTQDLDIKGQAAAGVRLFDLRIAAAGKSGQHGHGKEVELRAYHGVEKKETKTRYVADLNRSEAVTRTKLKGGTFGMGLTKMLTDASDFVTTNPSEFLILKFDKCSNWALIAEACVSVLGGTIYVGTGNLNTTKLRHLAGKVIVVFTAEGLRAVHRDYPVGSGILGIKSLTGGGSVYADDYDGLQYFGKGGTSVAKPFGKIGQNQSKQSKLMRNGSEGNPDVMGMMYWTSTGVLESIKKRNASMWTGSNVTALKTMWSAGLAESIESRVASHVDPTVHAFGGVLKAFMPNIVMIDFADDQKCRHIYTLNTVAATALTQAAQDLDDDVRQTQALHAKLPKGKQT